MATTPGKTTSGRILYAADALYDGVSGRSRRGHALLAEDGRLLAVGPAGELASAETPRRTFSGVIVPGFVDAHTHITIRPGEGDQHGQLRQPTAWQTIRGVRNLSRMLASGVTTARIMMERDDIDFEYRDAIARGEIAGPRLLVSGPGLSPPGGHGAGPDGVAGPQALREAVRVRAAKGADHIKMFTTGGVSSADSSLLQSNYTAEEIEAVIDEASDAGLPVAAHAHGGPGVDMAVAKGIHSIEHGALITPPSLQLMAERGTWLVLTHAIAFHPDGIENGDAKSPPIMVKLKEVRAIAEQGAAPLRESGVRIALGTDSMHGYFGYEMQWLVAHGWTAAEAMAAATSSGGDLIGDPCAGRLTPGGPADFVVLRRDPLADINAVTEVDHVFRHGIELAGSAREADGLVAVQQAPDRDRGSQGRPSSGRYGGPSCEPGSTAAAVAQPARSGPLS